MSTTAPDQAGQAPTAATAPCIVLGSGEPAGIGPDICLALAASEWPARLVALGDASLFRSRAAALALPIDIHVVARPGAAPTHRAGRLSVVDVPLAAPSSPGKLDPANARYVLELLTRCAAACLDGDAAAMVTAPVHKGVINDAGVAFSGHTEFLAARCGAAQPVMLLCAGTLRVALATTHLPLARVVDHIHAAGLRTTLSVLAADLERLFGIARPVIGVCGLNPHAGEGGHLGREEIDIIEPLLRAMRDEGYDLRGPLPADTAFTRRQLSELDAVLAMYHDQGLPVLKYAGFGDAVNVTLGLPIIRTSVDHGTALTLAASGQADAGSLHAATALAIELAGRNRQTQSDAPSTASAS